MSTVLVTGGHGYLGSHVSKELRRRGEAVRIFARSKPDGDQRVADEDVVWGDIRDAAAVGRAMQGVNKVIHLVSNFRSGGSDKSEAYGVNVEGTLNVLQAAERNGVQRVVHCSTIGVHGDVREVPANEQTPFNPTDLYQETKLIAERKVWAFHDESGLPVTVIRPISLIGPGDTRMLKLFRMIKGGHFIMFGSGRPYFQPAYIDDVVDGFCLALEHEKAVGEAFIVGGEEYVTLTELVQMVAEELNVPPPRWKFPIKPMIWLATVCEGVCVPLGIEPPLHRRRVSFFQNSRAFSVEKAKRLLGYQPQVSLREALRRTIGWYEANGWL